MSRAFGATLRRIGLDFRRVRSIAVGAPGPGRGDGLVSPSPRWPSADRGVVAVTAQFALSRPRRDAMTKKKSTKSTRMRSRTTAARGRTKTIRAAAGTGESSQRTSAAPGPARGPTKQAIVIGLLQRQEGASLADLVAATGWLPHTTRAALTRLRQAGHGLTKTSGEDGAVYRIATPARTARSGKAA